MSLLLSLLLLLTACEFQEVRRLPDDVPAESRAGDVPPAGDYEASLTSLLEQVVTGDGLVRYDLLRGPLNRDFRRVLKAVEDFDATRLLSQEARLAFWLNAYNVQMLQNIVETPAVRDIMADGLAERFFRTPYRTAGTGVTLDEIEHVILRGERFEERLAPFRLARLDPRIHVGLNCAAVSCPRLRRRAFTAENVDRELDAAMRDFTNDPKHFRREGDGFVLSALLDWFGSDFDATGRPAGDYLLSFMSPDRPDYAAFKALLAGRSAAAIRSRPDVRFVYDWTVNRAP
ncbi:DUF547 domain-containing protein [Rhodocaloribacter litoris]|uniref:DUF547 domain-containing protein n=1 Tax=Rhodocaloribacter litoris TaxID=2558931 RepID=UPI001E3DC672|nr:DUF547 domain-containing protein [Rhodocaloribacter litoris]QXD14728.1 DUF547 domain-containing protein [Rhodocaloribacter litoris]